MSTKLSISTEDNSYKESNIQVQIHADNSITSDHLESQGKISIKKNNLIKYGIKHNIATL